MKNIINLNKLPPNTYPITKSLSPTTHNHVAKHRLNIGLIHTVGANSGNTLVLELGRPLNINHKWHKLASPTSTDPMNSIPSTNPVVVVVVVDIVTETIVVLFYNNVVIQLMIEIV